MERQVVIGMLAIGLVMLLGNAAIVNAITCKEALPTLLNSCLSYLVGTGQTVDPACCVAVKTVNDAATTIEIRRDLCECFKQAAISYLLNERKAARFPELCHVQVRVPIDPYIDCSKIN